MNPYAQPTETDTVESETDGSDPNADDSIRATMVASHESRFAIDGTCNWDFVSVEVHR